MFELSLKWMTLIASISITVGLFIMAGLACHDDMFDDMKCDFWKLKWPYVSDVIMLPMFDRVFAILTTFFAIVVM